MTAMILVGGAGTRLKSVVSDVPKPMAPIQGKPFLEYQIRYLRKQDFKDIVLLTGHMEEAIRDHFGDGSDLNVSITYSHEEKPLGTGGAIRQALEDSTDESVVVFNGDSILLTDLHRFRREARAPITLAVHHEIDTARYGSVEIHGHRVVAFHEKNPAAGPGYVSSGIYFLDRKFYLNNTAGGKFSFESGFLPMQAAREEVYAVRCEGNFLDIGLPESFKQAQSLIPRWVP